MANPFVAALHALFASPMAADGIYIAAGGSPVPVRVIREQGSRSVDLNGGGVIVDVNAVQIRRSDIAEPHDGAALAIGSEQFTVQGGASLDVEGLTWRCELLPA